MLDEQYKKEVIEYIKNISPQELEKILLEIGCTKVKDNKGEIKHE